MEEEEGKKGKRKMNVKLEEDLKGEEGARTKWLERVWRNWNKRGKEVNRNTERRMRVKLEKTGRGRKVLEENGKKEHGGITMRRRKRGRG